MGPGKRNLRLALLQLGLVRTGLDATKKSCQDFVAQYSSNIVVILIDALHKAGMHIINLGENGKAEEIECTG